MASFLLTTSGALVERVLRKTVEAGRSVGVCSHARSGFTSSFGERNISNLRMRCTLLDIGALERSAQCQPLEVCHRPLKDDEQLAWTSVWRSTRAILGASSGTLGI